MYGNRTLFLHEFISKCKKILQTAHLPWRSRYRDVVYVFTDLINSCPKILRSRHHARSSTMLGYPCNHFTHSLHIRTIDGSVISNSTVTQCTQSVFLTKSSFSCHCHQGPTYHKLSIIISKIKASCLRPHKLYDHDHTFSWVIFSSLPSNQIYLFPFSTLSLTELQAMDEYVQGVWASFVSLFKFWLRFLSSCFCQ